MNSGNSQQQITLQAASKYGVSPQTLWGIYGAESSFGANPGVSSAGAQGPMQFMPATWRTYGGGRNVQDFSIAMPAAAHLLHDLGADTNPTSAATITAVNNYNGNRGGANAQTSYFQSVMKNAAQFHASGNTALAAASGTASSNTGASGSSGGNLDLLTILNDLATGNIADLAASLAIASVVGLKDIVVGLGDLIVAPLWHRNQRAVFYYYDTILLGRGAASDTPPMYQTWAATAAFWGLGYALLFTNGDDKLFTPSPVRNSRLARHTRRLQAVPARRTLVKPKDVKGKTPKQPKPQTSRYPITQVGTLTTTRNRPVKVSGTVEGRSNASGTASYTPVERIGTGTPPRQERPHSPFPESHPNDSGRGVSHPASGGVTKNPPKASGK